MLWDQDMLPVFFAALLVEVVGVARGEVVVVVVKHCLGVVLLVVDLVSSHHRCQVAVGPPEQVLGLDGGDVAGVAWSRESTRHVGAQHAAHAQAIVED